MRSTPVRYSDDSAGFDAPAKPIGTPAGLGRRVGPLALDHPLALLGIDALAGIGLQYRRVGLLDLQEERVVGDRRHQRHRAQGADAADADDLDRRIHQAIAVEQRRAGHRAKVSRYFASVSLHISMSPAARDASAWQIVGGVSRICGCPPACSTSNGRNPLSALSPARQ